MSVKWVPSIFFLVLTSTIPFALSAIAAVEILGRAGTIQLGAFTTTFIVLSVLSTLPFLWAYYRFVPLVVRAV